VLIFVALLTRTHHGGGSPSTLQLPYVRFYVLQAVSVSLPSMHGCSHVYRRGNLTYCHIVSDYGLVFLLQFIYMQLT